MELVKDELKIKIFDTRERMGRAAADDVAFCIKKLLAQKECINMILRQLLLRMIFRSFD